MIKRADIVIIGGGIMGVSIAYHLARMGQKDIVILEKNFLCEGSTGLSVGGFRQQFSTPSNILLSRESLNLFLSFRNKFGVDIDLHQPGYLFLARDRETWNDLGKGVQVQLEYGVPVEVLSPAEVLYRWPYLNIEGLVGGTFCSEDGYADPYLVTMTLAGEARKRGVLIQEQVEVMDILVENDKIQGVVTTGGKISSTCVVNAAGPWAARVARMVGTDLPVLPYRRQVFVVTSPPEVPHPVPMVIDMMDRHYFRGESGMILTGMSDLEEPPGFNLTVDDDFMNRVVETLVRGVPVMSGARMIRGWAGLYAITPDENPIIGAFEKVDGYYCAVGFSGHGFQHGPSVGRVVSDLILNGKTDLDLTPFAYDRFGRMQSREERHAV